MIKARTGGGALSVIEGRSWCLAGASSFGRLPRYLYKGAGLEFPSLVYREPEILRARMLLVSYFSAFV